MRRLVCTISAVFLFVACADSPTALQDDLSAPQFGKATIVRDGPVSFTGRTTFGAYYSVSGEVFQDPAVNYLDTVAELSFEGGNNVLLTMTESFPFPPYAELRTLEWAGKLTPGGVLKLEPEGADDQVAEIELHTGCTASGTLPVWHGWFDGQSLYAAAHFHGLCDSGTFWPTSREAGPLHVMFTIELEVDD
jgi:hypothetical protein